MNKELLLFLRHVCNRDMFIPADIYGASDVIYDLYTMFDKNEKPLFNKFGIYTGNDNDNNDNQNDKINYSKSEKLNFSKINQKFAFDLLKHAQTIQSLSNIEIQAKTWEKYKVKYIQLTAQEDFIGAFIHFRKVPKAPAKYRIYLHLADIGRGDVFGRILREIWPIQGLTNAKVVVPGVERNDSAVLYFATETAYQQALLKIAKVHQFSPNSFLPALPALVANIKDMVGVGMAMEPVGKIYDTRVVGGDTKLVSKKDNVSFGTYRANLLALALNMARKEHKDEKTQRIDDAESFFNSFKLFAEFTFRSGGIDPDNPHIQTEPKQIPLSVIAEQTWRRMQPGLERQRREARLRRLQRRNQQIIMQQKPKTYQLNTPSRGH